MGRTVSLVFVVDDFRLPGPHGTGKAGFLGLLPTGLIHADPNLVFGKIPLIRVQHLLHRRHERRVAARGNAPVLLQPRLDLLFSESSVPFLSRCSRRSPSPSDGRPAASASSGHNLRAGKNRPEPPASPPSLRPGVSVGGSPAPGGGERPPNPPKHNACAGVRPSKRRYPGRARCRHPGVCRRRAPRLPSAESAPDDDARRLRYRRRSLGVPGAPTPKGALDRASCPEDWPGSTPIPAPNPCRQARFPETGSVRSPREHERLHVRHRVCGDEQESAVPIGRSRVPTRTDTGPTRTDTEILPEYCRQFNGSVLLAWDGLAAGRSERDSSPRKRAPVQQPDMRLVDGFRETGKFRIA